MIHIESRRKSIHQRKSFSNFCKQYKFLLFIVIPTAVILTYFPKLFFYNYSTDTEKMIRFPKWTLQWWLRIDRYGLVFLKKILPYKTTINVFLLNFLTYFLLIIASILLLFIVYKVTEFSVHNLILQNLILFLPIGLFITSPIILEQTNFILQSVEVMFALCLLFLGFLCGIHFIESRRWFYCLSAVILSIICFSVYPSLAVSYVTLSVCYLFLDFINHHLSFSDYCKKTFILIVLFSVSYFLFKLGSKIILIYKKLAPSDYIMQASLLGKVSVAEYLQHMKHSLIDSFTIDSPFVLIAFLTLLILYILAVIFYSVTVGQYSFLIATTTILGTVVCSFFSFFLLGWIGPIRSLFPTYPILLFFFSYTIFSILFIKKLFSKMLIFPLSVLFFFIMGIQSFWTVQLGLGEADIYKQELTLTNEIKQKLNAMGISDYKKYKLAVIGITDIKTDFTGEILGVTLLNGDEHGIVGPSERVGDFLWTQGIDFQRISPKEYQSIIPLENEMDSFPKNNSIKIVDDIVILKLQPTAE